MLVGLSLIWLSNQEPQQYHTRLLFPFFKDWVPDIGWWYVPFAAFVLVAATNTVNLTDGLDGLAISTFAVSAATHALAYITGHALFAEYLDLVHFEPTGELTVFGGAMVGASLGFLWWNAHPADIFMGDVGSLGLGGALGTVALLTKQELLLPIVGGVFVLEGLSVILQVGSFAAREAHLQDGAASSPLRAHRVGGAQGHHAVSHPGDRVRPVQLTTLKLR